MSHSNRYHRRRPFVLAGLALIGLAATAAMPQAPSPTALRTLIQRVSIASHCPVATGKRSPSNIAAGRDNSAYFAEFTGVGAEGRDMVWRGAMAGAAVGDLTVRLAHVGRDLDTAGPAWPVEGIIFVSGEDPQRAFAAEVHGTIDWSTKHVQLVGEVSVGYRRGARFAQTADLIGDDLSGELHFAPATLAAR